MYNITKTTEDEATVLSVGLSVLVFNTPSPKHLSQMILSFRQVIFFTSLCFDLGFYRFPGNVCSP